MIVYVWRVSAPDTSTREKETKRRKKKEKTEKEREVVESSSRELYKITVRDTYVFTEITERTRDSTLIPNSGPLLDSASYGREFNTIEERTNYFVTWRITFRPVHA